MVQRVDPNMGSERLKEIMAEINAVLKEHDVAGYVVLVEPGMSEYRLALTPSWSALRYETNSDGAKGIRFRAKRADFESKAAQKKAIEDTVNLLAHLTDVISLHLSGFIKLRELVEQKLDVEYSKGKFVSHWRH